jgi:hypothetical protein
MTEKQKDYIPETKDVVNVRANRIIDAGPIAVQPAVQGPMQIIAQAIKNGAGEKELAILERMFDFDIRVKEREAKEAYSDSMSQWKANAPDIAKDRNVKFQTAKGPTEYSHASLANVTATINKSMSPFGLHAAWKTDQPNGKITVTCTISHRLGHSESTSLTAESDNSGNKNAIQALGSTISYLERYTILALTGLATHEQDTDGILTGEPEEAINDQNFADITTLIQEVGADETKFCKFLKIKSLSEMPVSMYERAIKELERKRK